MVLALLRRKTTLKHLPHPLISGAFRNMALTPASVYERVMPAMNMKVARAFHQLANFILSDRAHPSAHPFNSMISTERIFPPPRLQTRLVILTYHLPRLCHPRSSFFTPRKNFAFPKLAPESMLSSDQMSSAFPIILFPNTRLPYPSLSIHTLFFLLFIFLETRHPLPALLRAHSLTRRKLGTRLRP